jgi:hypothetical protein
MKRRAVLLGMLLFGFLAACGAADLTSLQQTLTPMSQSIRGTLTARAGQADSNDTLSTAIARATAQAGLVYSTETAVAALNEPARLATASAISPVLAELPRYGIDPAQGYVAWLHAPAKIKLDGFQQTGYANDFKNVTASDFVMAVDITWHTFNSASGCGFMFRSNGDTNKPSQYMVIITRVANGHLGFLGMADGKLANFKSFFPRDQDKSFNWFNDSTNRLAIVVRGNLIDMYTNGVLIGQADVTQPPDQPAISASKPDLPAGATDAQVQDFNNQVSQLGSGMDVLNGELSQAQKNFTTSNKILTDGFNGFVGLSQSGSMTCTFQNGWLFKLVK